MGCGSSTPAAGSSNDGKKNDIHRPHVTRSKAEAVPLDDTSKLPTGIQLTGGLKLRELGLLGQGVKVAVIDSGMDHSHPGFQGKVVDCKWYRKGTPLIEDDHGTHVGQVSKTSERDVLEIGTLPV